jgi:hypothetical protein
MRLDFGKRERAGVVVDEELEQEPACRGDTLAIMAQNGKQIFVFSQGMPLPDVGSIDGRRPSDMLHEATSKCNK